ncbi:MAG: hypothetical protein GY953_39025, partial [bacterium]|nr:hypothetical protein [bacterium]
FWDYSGGNMTDQGTHLMDVVQWLTGSGAPLSAVCQGRLVNADGAEAPNVFSAIFEYPEFLATWTLDYRSAYQNDWSITFIGEDATLVLDERGIRIFDDPGSSPKPWEMSHGAELSRMEPGNYTSEVHMRNMMDSIRSRTEPNCPIEVAAAAVAGPHMANIAYREGRIVKAAG